VKEKTDKLFSIRWFTLVAFIAYSIGYLLAALRIVTITQDTFRVFLNSVILAFASLLEIQVNKVKGDLGKTRKIIQIMAFPLAAIAAIIVVALFFLVISDNIVTVEMRFGSATLLLGVSTFVIFSVITALLKLITKE